VSKALAAKMPRPRLRRLVCAGDCAVELGASAALGFKLGAAGTLPRLVLPGAALTALWAQAVEEYAASHGGLPPLVEDAAPALAAVFLRLLKGEVRAALEEGELGPVATAVRDSFAIMAEEVAPA
jgi:hypothetical protein